MALVIFSLNANGLRTEYKRNAILDMRADILCLQETRWDDNLFNISRKQWKGQIYFSEGTPRARGVAICFNSAKITGINLVHRDLEGRLLVVDCVHEGRELRIINLHAPNGEKERRVFLAGLNVWCNSNCMIVGDFNVILTQSDLSSNNTFKGDSTRRTLRDLMENNQLVDIWRVLHPWKRVFSRRQLVANTLKQSRIDFALVQSRNVKLIKSVEYINNTWSDHAGIRLEVGGREGSANQRPWCFNASFLGDVVFMKSMRFFMKRMMDEWNDDENMSVWWESVKIRIKNKCVRYGIEKRKRENAEEDHLRKQLNEEIKLLDEEGNICTEKYVDLKEKLSALEVAKCRGAAIRSRIQYMYEGERSTAFFLGLEKQKQNKTEIKEVLDNNGQIITDKEEILKVVRDYYECLFKKDACDKDSVGEALEALKKTLSREDSVWCDCEFSVQEIYSAIDGLNKNKSPGSDGLTAEFYVGFKEILAPVVEKLCKYVEKTGWLPESMGLGIITIFYKNKGDNKNLDNYRPISLLNTDYKIIAKILANRIREVIGSVIGPTQAYSIPGRDIGDSIITIKQVVRDMEEEGGLWLGIDLNKAFDRVDQVFLGRVLEKLGFGTKLRGWVGLLYGGAKSKIKCNGVLTDSFDVKRSVRQGCPMSALLYSMVAEPLAALIANDKRVCGIGKGKISVMQYADDINVMVKSESDVDIVLKHIETYERASGAKINMEKSEIMGMGRNKDLNNKWGFKVVENKRKVLGVYVGSDENECDDLTWKDVIGRMQKTLCMWRARGLLLRGRVAVTNALVLSQVNHALSTCALPTWAEQKIAKVVRDFIWRSKAASIAHRTLIRVKDQGGLGLMDVLAKRTALRTKLIGKFRDASREAAWKGHFSQWLSTFGLLSKDNLLQMQNAAAYAHLPRFFQEVLNAWFLLFDKTTLVCESRASVMRLPFLSSPYFKQGGGGVIKSVALERAGLKRVGDLVDRGGRWDKERVIRIVREKGITYRKEVIVKVLERVEESVMSEWGDGFRNKGRVGQDDAVGISLRLGRETHTIADITTKIWYKHALTYRVQKPTCESKWTDTYPDITPNILWKYIDIPHTPHAIFDLDFKIRHRRIFTCIILHQMLRGVYGRTCMVCERRDEDFNHIFVYCCELAEFWGKIKGLLGGCSVGDCWVDRGWELSVLLGVNRKYKNWKTINMILGFARRAIFNRRKFAMYERRKLDVWRLFVNEWKRHLRMLYVVDEALFVSMFVESAGVCGVNENGIVWMTEQGIVWG